jgi:hypothetical protein
MRLLSADASASVQDVGLTTKVQPQFGDNLLSLTSPVGRVSLFAPELAAEVGLSTRIGDVSIALPDSPGVDLPPLALPDSPGLDLPSLFYPPGEAPPVGGAPSFSGALAPSGAAGALPRSGATAPMSPVLSPQGTFSTLQGQLGRTNDLLDSRGPADPARAGPVAHPLVPLDLSEIPQSQPNLFTGSNPSIASPLPEALAAMGGAPGSASSSTASGSVVGLLATLGLALLLGARRLKLADFFRGPILFVSLLERPG